jgi:hypothetical protein
MTERLSKVWLERRAAHAIAAGYFKAAGMQGRLVDECDLAIPRY